MPMNLGIERDGVTVEQGRLALDRERWELEKQILERELEVQGEVLRLLQGANTSEEAARLLEAFAKRLPSLSFAAVSGSPHRVCSS